jgi:photosystem II stability/assembly factor-like uncharacterized protein
MTRKRLVVVLLTCGISAFIFAAAIQLSGQGGSSNWDDPDLPPPDARTAMGKEEYLRARAEYYAEQRGIDGKFDPTVRAKAIEQMDAQEIELFNVLRGKAEKAGPNSRERMEFDISTTAWTELGPAPIPNGQTEGTSTPVNGRTTAIAIHPTNPNIAYVGTAQGGLYRTMDGGTTWEPLMDTAQSLAIGAVSFAPSDPSIVYVGTGEANLSADSFFGVGVYRINDALGATPTLTGPINPSVTTGIPGTTAFTGVSISRVVVHPTDPATIFVSTATGTSSNPSGLSVSTSVPPLALLGLYRSTNATGPINTITFDKLTVTTAGSLAPDNSGNRSIIDVVMEPGVPNRLICSVLGTNSSEPPDGGVYVTSNALDASPTFTRTLTLGAATVDANIGRAELAISKLADVTTVYVASGEASGAASCGTGGTLRRSTDSGATWSPPLPAGSGFCATQCFYDIALAVDPTNPLVVLLGGNVTGACSKLIARSQDGFATFTPANAGVHADNHVIQFAPSDTTIAYMGTDGGIYKSTTNGASWTQMNTPSFRAVQFQSIATHPNHREIMLGGTQDNGTIRKQFDGTWLRTDSGDGGYALFDRNNAGPENALAYHTTQAATNSISWRRSTNSGSTWSNRGCGTNGISCSDTVLFYPPIALGPDTADSPNTQNTFYYGTDRLYRSADGLVAVAASQRPLAVDGVPPATPVNQNLTTIAISPQNDNVRLVGLRNGKVFATTTGSATLADLTTSALPTPNPGNIRRAVSRAIIHPRQQKTAFITFGGYNVQNGHHIMKTTNLDTSEGAAAVQWTPSGFGIPDVPVNSITVDERAPQNMYAATDIGIYRSTDGGANWVPFSNGLPRVAVFDLAFQEQNGTVTTERVLRIATHGRGIWEIAVPTPAGQLTQVVSRKTHGSAGTFDVDLPVVGTRGIEPRSGGPNGEHTVVFTFSNPVASVGSASTSGGMVSSSGPGANPREYVVNITGVATPQNVTISLNNVVDSTGAAAEPVTVTMGVLTGDTNQNGTVNSTDLGETKSRSGQMTNGSNFLSDVTVNGSINSSDVGLIKSASGATLP